MKQFLFSKVDNFRYERKFYVEGHGREEVEAIIRLHPALFKEIYHERRVNNIYFDSFDLQHYFDNINGVDKRLKVRIRWYGDLFGAVNNPRLEIKLKHNFNIGKLHYSLKPFFFNREFSIEDARKLFEDSSIHQIPKLHLMDINFSLLNSYSRKYFLSSNGMYRVTVDTGMIVYRLSPYDNFFLDKISDDTSVILEIKYHQPHDELVGNITNYFPFRLTRSSKYVAGVERLQ